MVENCLFVHFNMFDANQLVHVLKDGQEQQVLPVETEALGRTLAQICETYNYNDVYISGSSEYIVSGIVEKLDEALEKKYSQRKVEVHIL